jgi:hypothetical protein
MHKPLMGEDVSACDENTVLQLVYVALLAQVKTREIHVHACCPKIVSRPCRSRAEAIP